MAEYTIRISNSETGEVIDRPMTAEEIAEHKAITAQVLAAAQAKTEQEAKKQEVIAKLGLTADEVAALLA